MECNVPVDQIRVFLGAIYQALCSQQQGITSMVAAQTGVPLHLCINSWRTQRSITRLFSQVVPGLCPGLHPQPSFQSCSTRDDSTSQQLESEGGTVQYVAIPGSKDVVMTPTDLWEVNHIPPTGSAQRPIMLSTDSDSGFGSID